MRVVDTSAWIEWFMATETGDRVGRLLPPAEEWLAPTIVQHELAKWLYRNVSKEASNRTIALSSTLRIAPLDTPIALLAANLSIAKKLATADAIVYATAIAHGADLLTCDAHFEGLDGVVFVSKEP